MNIEIKKDETRYNSLAIYLDNMKIGEVDDLYDHLPGMFVSIEKEHLKEIFKFRLIDIFKKDISKIELPINNSKYDYLDWFDKDTSLILCRDKKNHIQIVPNLFQWKKPISFKTLIIRLAKNSEIDFKFFQGVEEIKLDAIEKNWSILQGGFTLLFNNINFYEKIGKIRAWYLLNESSYLLDESHSEN